MADYRIIDADGHVMELDEQLREHIGPPYRDLEWHRAYSFWPGLTMDQMLAELRQIQQFVLLYPPQGEKGPRRAAVVRSKQTFPQQQLAKMLGLDELANHRV